MNTSRSMGFAIVGSLLAQLALSAATQAQSPDLKTEAVQAIGTAAYTEAIALLERVVEESPEDPEAHYLLGFATHYLSYDSLPLPQDERRSNSARVLMYLRRAASLDSLMGDAYYLLGVEYGARFLGAMQDGDLEGMLSALRRAQREGGFPAWLIEYNRNMLESCAPGAILLTSGDALAGSAWYLQYIEHVRRDVTVVPLGLLGRPWYLQTVREKSERVPSPLPIGWTRQQVLSAGPYKWKTNVVSRPPPEDVRRTYGIEDPDPFQWAVEPDMSLLGSGKTYLSKHRAALLDVLRTNAWQRPVHLAFGMPPELNGLESYLQIRGVTHRLLPVRTSSAVPAVDVIATEALMMNSESFRDLLISDN